MELYRKENSTLKGQLFAELWSVYKERGDVCRAEDPEKDNIREGIYPINLPERSGSSER